MKIVHYPHPALRHPGVPVKHIDKQLKVQVGEMFEKMYEARGLGLAAPQVALPYQLLVMNVTGDPEQADQESVYINPRIVEFEGQMDDEEGCLSFPDLWAKVRRAKKVKIKAFDLKGKPVEIDAEDLEARAWQHEMDHLNGVLFIDHFAALTKLAKRRELRSFESKFQKAQQRGLIADNVELDQMLDMLSAEMSR